MLTCDASFNLVDVGRLIEPNLHLHSLPFLASFHRGPYTSRRSCTISGRRSGQLRSRLRNAQDLRQLTSLRMLRGGMWSVTLTSCIATDYLVELS